MTTTGYPGFLASDIPPSSYDDAFIHIIPVEMEKSVSYGSGTAAGPRAILEASLQLEAFDGKTVPGSVGMYTHPPLRCDSATAEEDILLISSETAPVIRKQAVPIILGGEHTVTLGAVKALRDIGEGHEVACIRV